MFASLDAPLAAAPSPQPADPRAARLAKFKREQRIVEYLNRGVAVVEIAAQMGVSEKRMHAIVRDILDRRMPHPPKEFVAIQASRLNEALLVAYSAMSMTNLGAVDRVVKIVRELDRYHGLSAVAGRRRFEPDELAAPDEGTVAYGGAFVCRAEWAAADDEDLVLEYGTQDPLRRLIKRGIRQHGLRRPTSRPEYPPQRLEKIDSAPGPIEAAPGPAAQDPRALPGLLTRGTRRSAGRRTPWALNRLAPPGLATRQGHGRAGRLDACPTRIARNSRRNPLKSWNSAPGILRNPRADADAARGENSRLRAAAEPGAPIARGPTFARHPPRRGRPERVRRARRSPGNLAATP